MPENAASQYAVSGINRELIKKVVLLFIGVAAVVAILMIILPTRYYFSVHHGSVTLYEAKIPGFMPQPVKGYLDIPVGSEAIRSFAKQSFTGVDEAVAALREFLQTEITQQTAAVTAREKEMAELYESYVPDLEGARALGVKGLDDQVKALQGWMNYYKTKAAQ